MKIVDSVLKEHEEIIDHICNKCGKSCLGNIGNFNGLIEAQVYGGYDSTHIDDGDVYEFSLCEECIVEIMKDFKHPAKQYNHFE